MARRRPWADFVGHDVRIEWKKPKYDWHYFRVIDCFNASATLKSIADPKTGYTHIGDVFDARWSEVVSISAIGPVSNESSSAFFDMENGVLDRAKEIVDGRDKQQHYGPPEEFMGRLAKLWGGYLGVDVKPTDAALMMALLKAARLRTNPDHEDSLIDFAGYAHIYERIK